MTEFILTGAALVLLLTNGYALLLMYKDKKAAEKGDWRIPEKKLFIACAAFGALGACAGMFSFRHKTKHWYFRVFFPMMLVIQIALLAAGVYFIIL